MAKKLSYLFLIVIIGIVVSLGVCFVYAPTENFNVKIYDKDYNLVLNKTYNINSNVTRKAKNHNKTYDFLLTKNQNTEDLAGKINRELAQDVKTILEKNNKKPENANSYVNLGTSSDFEYKKEVNGYKVNEARFSKDIIHLLNKNKKSIILKYIDVKPEITIEKLQLKKWKISSFSTNYGFSCENRASNLELASKLLNNSIVYPNETFSFNKRLGERNREKGFKEAPIIDQGKYVPGVGGGVCQVSTTLYNAVILAGLDVETVHNHTLPIGYIEPSFDAMVSSWSDLVFKNNLTEPIIIKSFCKNYRIYFEIYGQKQNFYIERISKLVKTIPYETEYVELDDLKDDEERILKNGKLGRISYGYLIYHYDDKTTKIIKIRKDFYKPQNEIVGKKINKDLIEKEKDTVNIDLKSI